MSAPLSGGVSEQRAVMQSLLRRLPGYTPEWTLATGAKGYALLDVLARYRALLQVGSSGLPERNLLALLDMLAIPLLPAQAARVPLVFQLTPNSPVDVTVAADSQLAAQLPPPPPSPMASAATDSPPPVLFFTEQTVTLTRANLAVLYSVDPETDTYADHSATSTAGFTVFGDMERTEHALYLGHDQLFKLGGQEITLLLQCTLDVAPPQPLDIHWQYLSEAGWITLQRAEDEDTTRGLTRDGQIALRLNCGPDAKKETYSGRTTYWVRGTLNTPVIRGENLRHNPLTINDLRIRVQFKKKDLLPEAAFADATRLDVTKDFYPFGQQPATFNTFYVASNEVFQRAGARVHIDIHLSSKGDPKPATDGAFVLRWEYYGSGGWQILGIEPGPDAADAYKFDADPTDTRRISFNCPSEWQETLVNGVKNRWLRVRITKGSYNEVGGVPVGTATLPVTINNTPPVVAALKLSYTYITDPETLDHCLTRNDFQFEDHSEDARWPDRSFDPYWPVSDQRPAVHFGFDQALPAGLVSLYVQVPGAEEQEPGSSTAFTWEYLSRGGWLQLGVRDETNGLRQSGMVQFIGPPDAVAAPGLGDTRYRIRARLKDGVGIAQLPVSGIWLNAAWASHRVRIEQELLGTADGTPGQALRFARTPGAGGRARRDPGMERQRRRLAHRRAAGAGGGPALRARTRDRKDPRGLGPLARTSAPLRRAAAGPGLRRGARHRPDPLWQRYARHDSPGGQPDRRDLTSGGGAEGNVPRQSVTQLRSAVPFVASVTNPVAAAGGADGESLAAIRDSRPAAAAAS